MMFLLLARLFLSTLPAWGATTYKRTQSASQSEFLSTLPAWGATGLRSIHNTQINISIHAPRVGSDAKPCFIDIKFTAFLSTLPAWGATTGDCGRGIKNGQFLSTLPAWGATGLQILQGIRMEYFYPRSPRGERRSFGSKTYQEFLTFLSTLPAWGATGFPGSCRTWQEISIHAPRVGSDSCQVVQTSLATNFYPRSPRGERLKKSLYSPSATSFLSTLPAWGATAKTDKNNNIFCAV